MHNVHCTLAYLLYVCDNGKMASSRYAAYTTAFIETKLTKKKMWKTVPASLFCVLMHLNVADCRRMQISSASRQINWPALQSVWLAAKYWCASLLAYANYIYKAHLPVHTGIGFTRMIGASQRTWLTFIIINIRHRVRMECVYTWAQVTHLNQI